MDEPRVDLVWPDSVDTASSARQVFIHDELRYAQGANQRDVELDGFINYHWLTSPETWRGRKSCSRPVSMRQRKWLGRMAPGEP